jgi:MFS family permease
MPLVIGSMMSGDRAKAMSMGAIAHFIVMGTVVFGIVYGLLLSAFDSDAWWVGTLIGLAHGVIVGVLFMPMMPAMHPRMSGELATAGSAGWHPLGHRVEPLTFGPRFDEGTAVRCVRADAVVQSGSSDGGRSGCSGSEPSPSSCSPKRRSRATAASGSAGDCRASETLISW